MSLLQPLTLGRAVCTEQKDIKFASQLVGSAGPKIALAIATVPLPLNVWLKRDGTAAVVDGLRAFCADNQLHALGVMTTGKAEAVAAAAAAGGSESVGAFTRQLGLYVPPSKGAGAPNATALFASLTTYLETQTDLKLAPFDVSPATYGAAPASGSGVGGQYVFYRQVNIEASRKQVYPFVLSAIAAAKL